MIERASDDLTGFALSFSIIKSSAHSVENINQLDNNLYLNANVQEQLLQLEFEFLIEK